MIRVIILSLLLSPKVKQKKGVIKWLFFSIDIYYLFLYVGRYGRPFPIIRRKNMGKQSFRNITIKNGDIEEKWKWRFGTKDVTVISPDNKKTYIPTHLLQEEVIDGDSNEFIGTYVSPKMIASYIYEMLGLPMPEKKVVPTPVKEASLSFKKSKIYVIIKTHTFIDEEYGYSSQSKDIYEIWQDPSKAKKRADELNKDSMKIYLYDQLHSEYSVQFHTGEYKHGKDKWNLLQEKGYQGVDYFKNDKAYIDILNQLGFDSTLFEKAEFKPKAHRNIGYNFHAEERDLMV